MKKNSSETNPLASRLRLAREHAGLSQGQVAKLLGLHRPSVTEIEAGNRKVSAIELAEFAKTYQVSLDWLSGTGAIDSDQDNDRVELAARELAKLKPDDLDRVYNLLRVMRKKEG